MQEETEQEEAAMLVTPEEIPTGLRRNSRTSKPTKEIVNCREELKDDNIGVKRRGSYLAENASSVNSEQRVRYSFSTAEPVSHPTSPGLARMPPPVKRKVSRPPAEEQDAGADITPITPKQARKMCTMKKKFVVLTESEGGNDKED